MTGLTRELRKPVARKMACEILKSARSYAKQYDKYCRAAIYCYADQWVFAPGTLVEKMVARYLSQRYQTISLQDEERNNERFKRKQI